LKAAPADGSAPGTAVPLARMRQNELTRISWKWVATIAKGLPSDAAVRTAPQYFPSLRRRILFLYRPRWITELIRKPEVVVRLSYPSSGRRLALISTSAPRKRGGWIEACSGI
jgi:hypothetical protein